MAEPELYPVRVGGHIVAYRPKSTDSKSAKKQATAKGSASKAEEANK